MLAGSPAASALRQPVSHDRADLLDDAFAASRYSTRSPKVLSSPGLLSGLAFNIEFAENIDGKSSHHPALFSVRSGLTSLSAKSAARSVVRPVAACVLGLIRRAELIFQERDVAGVGLDADVEKVTRQWNQPDPPVQRVVGEHLADQLRRRAEPAGLGDDQAGHRPAHRVADDGHQPDDAVEPEAHRHQRQAKARVHQVRDGTQPPEAALGRGVERRARIVHAERSRVPPAARQALRRDRRGRGGLAVTPMVRSPSARYHQRWSSPDAAFFQVDLGIARAESPLHGVHGDLTNIWRELPTARRRSLASVRSPMMTEPNGITSAGMSAADRERRRVVFVSYKHEDQEIADTLADHLIALAGEKLDVVVSNHPDLKGLTFGGNLTEELKDRLQVTEVFFFIYTGKGKDYSWCMYEAGLATSPKSVKGTRIIVFSLVDYVPSVFEGKVVVHAKQLAELKKLLTNFCVQSDFFPGEHGALFDDTGIIRGAASSKAEELHAALSHKFDLERREVPRWPSLVIEMNKESLEIFKEMFEKKEREIFLNLTKPQEEVDFFLQHALVIHSEVGGSNMFNWTWQEGAREPLAKLRSNWLKAREQRVDVAIAENTPWDLVLAKEVYNICQSVPPSPDWSSFLDLSDRSSTRWLYPLISTSFINRDGSREFRIRIVPFLAPGEAAPGE